MTPVHCISLKTNARAVYITIYQMCCLWDCGCAVNTVGPLKWEIYTALGVQDHKIVLHCLNTPWSPPRLYSWPPADFSSSSIYQVCYLQSVATWSQAEVKDTAGRLLKIRKEAGKQLIAYLPRPSASLRVTTLVQRSWFTWELQEQFLYVGNYWWNVCFTASHCM